MPLSDQLKEPITAALQSVAGVESVTLTGSVTSQDDLRAVSDIDTIVVLDRLTAAGFAACVAAVEALSGDDLGLPGYRVEVNATFGPLKFDTPDTAVVHLMVYDRASHRDHVLKSPFTCLDWERSGCCSGPSLRDLAPVLGISPADFISARRGLENYLDDLSRGAISFRRYAFSDEGAPTQVVESFPLDARHRSEYAFHVIKNLAINWWKMWHRQNAVPEMEALLAGWDEWLPEGERVVPVLRALHAAKRSGGSFPDGASETAEHFVRAFMEWLGETLAHAPRLRLIRHGRTALNDGRFLGQGSDPGIEAPGDARSWKPDALWCSPLLRAQETAAALFPGAAVEQDDRWAEIDYGEAEGLRVEALAEAFPEVVAGWRSAEDPRFPGGENSADVAGRAQAALAVISLEPGETGAVVTHNVVIRCLVGELLGLAMSEWVSLQIPHEKEIELVSLQGRWFVVSTMEQREAWTDQLTR